MFRERERIEVTSSKINTLLRCGQLFIFQYLDKIYRPVDWLLWRGTLLHFAREINLQNKQLSKENMRFDDIVQAVLEKKKEEEEKEKITNAPSEYIQEKEIVGAVAADYPRQKLINPILVEVRLRKKVLETAEYDVEVTGKLDVMEKDKIRDLKTTKIKPTLDDIQRKSIQFTLYHWLANENRYGNKKLQIDYLVFSKNGQAFIQDKVFNATKEDYSVLTRLINLYIKSITAGVFPPSSPYAWWCGKKCPYFDICPYMKHKMFLDIGGEHAI